MRNLVAIMILFSATLASGLDLQSVLADGWKYFDNANYKAASKTFESAARIDPASPESFKGLGMSYMKMGYTEYSQDIDLMVKATQSFEKALQLNPNMPDVRYQLGVASLALDDKPGAERQYQALNPVDNKLAGQLAEKIAKYHSPKNYRHVATYGSESIAGGNNWGNCSSGQIWNSLTNTCSTPPQMTRQESETTITSTPEFETRSRKRSRENQNYKVNNERKTVNTGAINPITGEYYAPSGSGYVGTRDGTYYAPAGPSGVIDTKTGKFIPVH